MLPNAELAVPTAEDLELVERAREVIDANTDAGPDEDDTQSIGGQFETPTAVCSPE
ncbi:hypothetical protein [Cryobacterium sp. MLB-32]|uniref:hypothetical protein n=1 Tax=Cryobacterium sp. MLB-32 TaxID=1529318 RepID=UPI0012DFF120|nr:hypothetical protein [Cryobacterium sp. MLB-32]